MELIRILTDTVVLLGLLGCAVVSPGAAFLFGKSLPELSRWVAIGVSGALAPIFVVAVFFAMVRSDTGSDDLLNQHLQWFVGYHVFELFLFLVAGLFAARFVYGRLWPVVVVPDDLAKEFD